MENFLIYLLKASTGIVLFYLFYYLVLRKETFYVSNRLYLIAGLVLAVLLPAFPVSYTTPVALINNSNFFAINTDNHGILNTYPFPHSPHQEALTCAQRRRKGGDDFHFATWFCL